MSKVLPILNVEFRKKESDARLEPNTAWERRIFDPPLADNVGCSKLVARAMRFYPIISAIQTTADQPPAACFVRFDAEIKSGWLLGL